MINSQAYKVGILIPTFNRRIFLEPALRSALEQTYRNVQIIVVNDASTDETTDFMAGLSDPRMKHVINEQNLGLIKSINKGVTLFDTEVEWCTILCDDDVLDREFVSKLMLTVRTLPVKNIIHSHRIFIDSQGKTIRDAAPFPSEETAVDYLKMRAYSEKETYLTGVLFNRKAFTEIGGYPAFSSGLAADDAFIFALSLKDRLVFEQSTFAYIRLHEGAESKTYSDGITKLHAIKQFNDYCEKTAREFGGFDDIQRNDFNKTLLWYVRALSSDWWIKTAHWFLDRGDKNQEQLSQLLSFVNESRNFFTFRVKFAVACRRLTGIFPERYSSYRAMWHQIINFSKSKLRN